MLFEPTLLNIIVKHQFVKKLENDCIFIDFSISKELLTCKVGLVRDNVSTSALCWLIASAHCADRVAENSEGRSDTILPFLFRLLLSQN